MIIRAEDRPRDDAQWRLAAGLVVDRVSKEFRVSKAQLGMRNRCQRDVAAARQTAMYLLHIVFGGTFQEAGLALGRERTTVAYACSLVEDKRDCPVFDAQLEQMERVIRQLWIIERLREMRQFKAQTVARAAA